MDITNIEYCTDTVVKVFGWSIELSSWLRSERERRICKPKRGLLAISKVWFPAFMLSELGAGSLKADTGSWRAEPWLRFRPARQPYG
eukprot:6224162-Amphidinium_carterae.1